MRTRCKRGTLANREMEAQAHSGVERTLCVQLLAEVVGVAEEQTGRCGTTVGSRGSSGDKYLPRLYLYRVRRRCAAYNRIGLLGRLEAAVRGRDGFTFSGSSTFALPYESGGVRLIVVNSVAAG